MDAKCYDLLTRLLKNEIAQYVYQDTDFITVILVIIIIHIHVLLLRCHNGIQHYPIDFADTPE